MNTTLIKNDERNENIDMTRNGSAKVRLIQEALSRARTRRPQSELTLEAHRPARQVAMEVRHRTANELGGRL
jgi:hypothetical protein